MVRLNRAIATAMVHGPSAGLELLADLEGDRRLSDQHRFEAVWAHLLEMSGDPEAALERFRAAAERATNIPERDYLLAQVVRLGTAPGVGDG
jgi:predicted RNA polymerase sigma factor